MKHYIKLMRPKQWIKGFFVFAALIFARKFTELDAIGWTSLLFVYFTIASSAIYVFNDLYDLEKDIHHPKKKNRPIASGRVSKRNAILLMVVLTVFCLLLGFNFNWKVNLIILLYLINNLFYTLKLKNSIIIDVMIISVGFLLRVVAGAFVLDVYISSWIIICTFFLSMLIALGKRRSEMIFLEEAAAKHRGNLKMYSVKLLDYMLIISVACTLMTYSLYAILEYSNQLILFTIIFVFYGVFRYMFLLLKGDGSKSPEEIIIGDKPLIIDILAFGIACILILLLV